MLLSNEISLLLWCSSTTEIIRSYEKKFKKITYRFLPESEKTLSKYNTVLNSWGVPGWLVPQFAFYFKFSAIFLVIAHNVIMQVKHQTV